MYLNQKLAQLLSKWMLFLAILGLSGCGGDPDEPTTSSPADEPTIPSPASAPPKQQPETDPPRNSNTFSNTGPGSPKPSRPVKTPRKGPTEAVKQEAFDQSNKAQAEAAEAISKAIGEISYERYYINNHGKLANYPSCRITRVCNFISGKATQKVSQHVQQIREALTKAKEAQAKAATLDVKCNVASVQTILAAANVVEAATQSMVARLQAEVAVIQRDPNANSITANAKTAIQQALQTATDAMEAEKK